jgi:hypothetical protein
VTSRGRIMPAAAWILLAAAWLALVGVGQWRAADQLREPPSWDTYSYALKAANVWAGVGADAAVNPLDAEPAVRPPGVVLMSHPSGFNLDARGYYFRSVFLPVLLCALAVYIAAFSRGLSMNAHGALAATAVVLSGLPMFFQFQLGEALPAASFWGMVDGFLAGVAAVAMACVVRSVRDTSVAWALAAAVCAAFAFMVKPSGALVMALVGASWLVLAVHRHAVRSTYVVVSFGGAAAVYALTAAAALSSAYLSPATLAFGRAALSVMAQDFMALSELTPGSIALLLHLALGPAGLVLLVLGLIVAARADRAALAAALLCLAVGLWFWLIQSGAEVVRYFLPFPVMAVVLLTPALMAWLAARITWSIVLVAPAVATTTLLFMPTQPVPMQRALGINLATNAYEAENEQGAALLKLWRESGEQGGAYVFDTTPALRNVWAVLEYAALAEPERKVFPRALPVDWQRASAFRLEELARARFLVFEPVTDAAAVLADREVPDFHAETRVMSAWASGLGEAQGVRVVSDTRVRVLEVADASVFGRELERLRGAYGWPPAFRAANSRIWWSREDLDALIARGEAARTAARFARPDAVDGFVIEAASARRDAEGLHLDVWVDAGSNPRQWTVFAHLVSADGAMVGNAQADLAAAPAAAPLRLYRLFYVAPPPGAVAAGLGFFKQDGGALNLLATPSQPSDWDGRRFILPLPPMK